MTTEFLEGDLVEAVKGEERHIGRLTFNSFVKGLILGAPGGSLDWFTKEGFTLTLIERPKPKVELPTEMGVYVDRQGDSWALGRLGDWKLLHTSFSTRSPEKWAPFTRLESRADTANLIADWFESKFGIGVPGNQRIASRIREHFGVTDA